MGCERSRMAQPIPRLPAVIDAGVHRTDPYLVTALAPGESLDVALREYGPAAIADALPRLRHLADALDSAAAAGVWHGALQPRDILIDGQDTHMIGLGITPILERAGVHRSTRRPYAAPELMNGDPTSPATDQYALGAIAYEWFFGGRAPRSAESVLDAPSLPGVDAEALAGALMSALATNPTERFASCTAFVEAIDDALETSVLSDDDEEVMAGAGLLPLEGFVAEDAPDHSDDDHELGDRRNAASAGRHSAQGSAATAAAIDRDRLRPLLRRVSRPAPVAWQGSLGVMTPPAARRRAYSAGTLVAALVTGAALGGAAGYMFATSRVQPTEASLPAANGQVTAADAQPAKEFTDAAVSPAPPAPAPPPPDAARTAVAEPVRTPPPAPPRKSSPLTTRDRQSADPKFALRAPWSPSTAPREERRRSRSGTWRSGRGRRPEPSRVRVERAPGHAHGRSAIAFARRAALTDLCRRRLRDRRAKRGRRPP